MNIFEFIEMCKSCSDRDKCHVIGCWLDKNKGDRNE